ncbi:MAG: MFS transporter [Jiangellaceae bacterium]
MRRPAESGPRGSTVLTLGTIGVLLAAADTYVVVLALPDLMLGVGLDVDELQRAAPLVTMFLLGNVVVLPLAGRVSDVVGRQPVLLGSLLVFAAGSLLTASADGLPGAVAGRFLQGSGGGALVPVTLALVADRWPAERRGLPLGVVGAVQELGAVLGPLYGALVLAIADWRAIFWVNLAGGLLLAAGLRAAAVGTASRRTRDERGGGRDHHTGTGRRDVAGALLATVAAVTGGVTLIRPSVLESSVMWGGLVEPVAGNVRWTSPLALMAVAAALAFLWRELTASRPMLDVCRMPDVVRAADVPGALLLGVALGGIVLAFAAADPAIEMVAPAGPWLLAGSAVSLATFVRWQQRVRRPLVPPSAVRATPAWGALVVSLFVGAALVAVLVDVPVLVRTVVDGASQLDAAFVLVRFLAALPVGALLGGWLVRSAPPGLITATGMGAAAAGLAAMSTWGVGSMSGWGDDVVLGATGFGFGLAVAPVNAALLAATPRDSHGIASALVVAARMVGMLAGLSALTAIGLRRLYAVQAGIESPAVTCPQRPTDCEPYQAAVREAVVEQLQVTFAGAAVCAAAAAITAAALLRRRLEAVPS